MIPKLNALQMATTVRDLPWSNNSIIKKKKVLPPLQVLGLSISVTLKCCFSRSFSRGQMPCYSFLLLHLSIWGHGFMNVRSVQNATRSLESKPALHSPITCRSAALVSFLFFFFPFTTTLPERALTGKFISVNKIQALKIWKQVRCFACTSLPQKKKNIFFFHWRLSL